MPLTSCCWRCNAGLHPLLVSSSRIDQRGQETSVNAIVGATTTGPVSTMRPGSSEAAGCQRRSWLWSCVQGASFRIKLARVAVDLHGELVGPASSSRGIGQEEETQGCTAISISSSLHAPIPDRSFAQHLEHKVRGCRRDRHRVELLLFDYHIQVFTDDLGLGSNAQLSSAIAISTFSDFHVGNPQC